MQVKKAADKPQPFVLFIQFFLKNCHIAAADKTHHQAKYGQKVPQSLGINPGTGTQQQNDSREEYRLRHIVLPVLLCHHRIEGFPGEQTSQRMVSEPPDKDTDFRKE